jgi:hypothetical protein
MNRSIYNHAECFMRRIKLKISASAEFICHDILSFTESWLTPRVGDNDMIIPGYKPPFRRDMVGGKGEGF